MDYLRQKMHDASTYAGAVEKNKAIEVAAEIIRPLVAQITEFDANRGEAHALLQEVAKVARGAAAGAGEMDDLEDLPREIADLHRHPNRAEPAPEMREVHRNRITDGDLVTGTYRRVDPSPAPGIHVELGQADTAGFLVDVTVSRPIIPVPKLEGAVIRCLLYQKLEQYVGERYEGRWLIAGLPNPDQVGVVSQGFPDSAIREVLAVLDPGRPRLDRQEAGRS